MHNIKHKNTPTYPFTSKKKFNLIMIHYKGIFLFMLSNVKIPNNFIKVIKHNFQKTLLRILKIPKSPFYIF
jgi:hypothetical protein